MKPLPLTAIILTHRNDDRFLAALRSISFASEILVIDNESSADWKELKKQFPLKVISLKEPITNFSQVRNDALKQATNDWVLFLDSDEEVLQPAVPQLAELLSSTSAKGGILHRSDVFYAKTLEYGEAGNQPLIRLGKKSAMRFHGNTHEVATIDGESAYTKIQLLHHAHPSISEFIADVSRYAREVAKEKNTTLGKNLLELLLFPPAKLLYSLIIQGGILDGWQGVVYAFCMSLHSLLVRVYRYEILARPYNNKH